MPALIGQAERALYIRQGYAVDDNGRYRLRAAQNTATGDTKYFKTRKYRIAGVGRIARREDEKQIAEADFETEWPETEGARIEKVRLDIPHGGLVVELDAFLTIPGLMIAEVEFASQKAATNPDLILPEWLGAELTERKGWGNRKLALNGVPEDPQILYGKS